MLRLIRRMVPLTDDYHGEQDLHGRDGKRMATPMLAALAMVATFDVIFAIDSIPAIFAVTRDTFIVFAANAFALLGLTSLYFLLGGAARALPLPELRPRVRSSSSSAPRCCSTDIWHVPIWMSLVVIVGTLLVAAWASRKWPKDEEHDHDDVTRPPTAAAV